MTRLTACLIRVALLVIVALPAMAVERVAWTRLSPAQQQALAPLQADWTRLEPERQAKWLEVAARFATMNSAERQRLHARMAEWSRLTPAQRQTARLQFQEARRISPEDRQAAWRAYQSLPEQQRQQLALRERPPARTTASGAGSASAVRAKENVVQSAPPSPQRTAAAAVLQARPGATTLPMNQTPLPPAVIQHGLPKIAATPGFVDPATLLPRRGPQGAAATRASASASAVTP